MIFAQNVLKSLSHLAFLKQSPTWAFLCPWNQTDWKLL